MNYKNMTQEERDQLLLQELSAEKHEIIRKYNMHSTPELRWVSNDENAHEQVYFTHRFAKNTDVIGLLFRVNRLCGAKVNYFRENTDKFDPCFHNPLLGFVRTSWAGAEFLKHRKSGHYIDLRYLRSIKNIEEFRRFCLGMEFWKEITFG